MTKLLAPLEVEQSQTGDWRLVFLLGDTFDYTTPFRSILKKVVSILEEDRQVDIKLPEYEEYEDFVEGTLQFGGSLLGIYFEYSLSYLALSSGSKQVVLEIMDRVQVEFES